jgi:hypothetical protein
VELLNGKSDHVLQRHTAGWNMHPHDR